MIVGSCEAATPEIASLSCIRQGSRIEFLLVGDHVEMRVASSPTGLSDNGFGMLKSRRAALPVDLDPATLLKR